MSDETIAPMIITADHAIIAVQIIQHLASEAIKQDASVLLLRAPVVQQIIDLNNDMMRAGGES